jgi:hypothetical protein
MSDSMFYRRPGEFCCGSHASSRGYRRRESNLPVFVVRYVS